MLKQGRPSSANGANLSLGLSRRCMCWGERRARTSSCQQPKSFARRMTVLVAPLPLKGLLGVVFGVWAIEAGAKGLEPGEPVALPPQYNIHRL